MFNSLKSWLNVPVIIRPFVKRSGTGKKDFGTNRETVCMPAGEVKVVTNSEGKEVVSNMQLYVDGADAVTERDNVIFNGSETEIKAIGYSYRNGVVDLKVVYL